MERMLGYLLLIAALIILAPTASGQSALVRERLSLNLAWHFQRNDPSGAEGRLNYEKIKEWILVSLAFSTGALSGISSARESDSRPTLFIIGDSTVKNNTAGQQGWGDPLAEYFDKTKIHVVNRAIGGRSSRTFQTEGRWDQILAELKPGDFVLMQFGHNDGGAINDTSRARGSIRGTGEETQEIDNLLTKKHEVVHTYGWYLRKYVRDTNAKGAVPIVLSPVPRKIWKDAKIVRASSDYGKWAAEVAKSEGAAFVDLNETIARRYEEMGVEKVNMLFADEHTHTNAAGAEINANSVVVGLKGLKSCSLCKYFSEKAKEVDAFKNATKSPRHKEALRRQTLFLILCATSCLRALVA